MKGFIGIDIGALSTDGVLIDETYNVLSQVVLETGYDALHATEEVLKTLLNNSGLDRDEVSYIISTGYGRQRAAFADEHVTEITCHARGAHQLFPNTGLVIDIGGQDSKVIRINESGRVLDFVMNDKCAAGTGRFLETMARALSLDIATFGRMSLDTSEAAQVSSMCTVFAESEVVSLLHKGVPRERIIRGLHNAISNRIIGMVERVGRDGEVTMSGGVAKNPGMVRALEEKLKMRLNIPEEPQTVGALGAALIAAEKFLKKKANA